MGFGRWRRRSRANKFRPSGKKQPGDDIHLELHNLVIPNQFLCPISLELMTDPVTLSSGMTYDRDCIEKWLEEGNFTCPVTNQLLRSFDLIPNHTLRRMIQEWCEENRHHGIERIPTPKIPITTYEVSEVLSCVSYASRCADWAGCLELVEKISLWGGESERNRRCIVVNGAASVLAAAFDAFVAANNTGSKQNWSGSDLLERILCALSWMFPLDIEAQQHLGSPNSLSCMVWFLKNSGNISTKKNAIHALKELSCDEDHAKAISQVEGVREVLTEFIRHPVNPTITKASLSLAFNLISSPGMERSIFVEMGLVSMLLEILIDCDNSTCEKALGVLDGLIGCEQGREDARAHSLTVPILVKKILRVTESATELAVSSLWRLCKYDHQEGSVLVDALQVGAFQKILLLLQLGCGDVTKEKATELLKLMNPHRVDMECIESSDFKNLKRSF